MSRAFDYTCIIHGKKMSEHPPYGCLYCCLCFCDLTPETCHVLPDGTKEDVCNECAKQEKEQLDEYKARDGERLAPGEAGEADAR